MHRRGGLDVAGLVDQVVGELDRTHAAGLEDIQTIQIALQEIAAFHGEYQGRVAAVDVLRLAGDAHAGRLECAKVLIDAGQALTRLRIPHLFQPFCRRMAPDHRQISDGRHHRGGHSTGRHGCQDAEIDRPDPIGPSGVSVHVDDHGHAESHSVVGE